MTRMCDMISSFLVEFVAWFSIDDDLAVLAPIYRC